KGSRVWRGVKEKQSSLTDKSTEISKHVDETLGTNYPTRTPNVVNAGLGSYPTLSEEHGHSTTSENEDDMNVVGTKVRPSSAESIRAISEQFANTTYCFFLKSGWLTPLLLTIDDGLSVIAIKLDTPLMIHSYTSGMCMQSWSESSYVRAMIEFRANVELKDTIVVPIPKLVGEGMSVPSIKFRCGEELEESFQTLRGVPVGPKVGFKPVKQVYRPLFKKNIVNTSGNKKNDVESRKE
nr:hypothetical protein [Tanacetum cinerariifolium]